MSQVSVSGVDARAYLGGWASAVTDMTIKDIKAIPDDQWTKNYGGCARSAGALIADTVTNLRWTTAVLKGEESDAYNHMDDLAAKYVDRSQAITDFKGATEAFVAALSSASDETLNSTVMAPWQMPTPVMMLAHIAASHIWYHDGQLNYVQCLNGDGNVHWM